MDEQLSYTAFCGNQRIASGSLAAMLTAVKAWAAEHGEAGILYFDDLTGKQTDFNLRETVPEPRTGPGRPKLGVVSREISLLPRHWEWLEQQPSGASAALRRLVDQARNSPADRERRGREAAGRFLSAMAGNFAGYEEAMRALWQGDRERMRSFMADWPLDVCAYAERLL